MHAWWRNRRPEPASFPDALLPKAIAAVEHARETGGHADYAALLSALNATIRAIAPITLIDLREGRSPFDAGARRSARRLVAFCFVSCRSP
jgi:hypothetical protein